MQEGDVKLFQTNDDGDINVTDGLIEMSGGIETSAYLCLFGGNEQDDGRPDNNLQWWGNVGEKTKYQSETQFLLKSIPATTGNLKRIKEAAIRDLSSLPAKSIEVIISMPRLNMVKLEINIDGIPIEFTNQWGN